MDMPATHTVGAPRGVNRSTGRGAPVSLAARRWSWVWLVVGTMLLPFASLQTLIPVTAWLAPVFLLRFTRSQRPLVGLPVLALAMSGALLLGLRNDFFPIADGADYYVFVATLAFGGALPFAVDRWLSPRLNGVFRTLVFPAAVTASKLLGALSSPFGTAGSAAYSQYGSLPLIQLVSVTGIWGLTFLVSWLAPVVNQAGERVVRFRGEGPRRAAGRRHHRRSAVRRGTPCLRRAGRRDGARGGSGPDRGLSDLAYSAPDIRSSDRAERAAAGTRYFAPVLDDLFERSEREAQAGAKIIAWSEAAARILAEEQEGGGGPRRSPGPRAGCLPAGLDDGSAARRDR